ncbi:hypothetical protein D0T84_06575 [Dysgonomonas sp. 521]|uniref:hypothetical protein n=1 Tax=Dysgonomonas sp. 521 TaxID=2302932 RepID=UPI0013D1D659|nr:hypothetical protein [Dysgonomonas sp. 521]NDV94586.1 hypothetical protein [Dysgonomonas sp. 521]
MQKLRKATDEFIRVISLPSSTKDELNKALQECYKCFDDSTDEEILVFMKRVFGLHNLPDMERASTATIICGYLVERGFSSDSILHPLIDLYDNLLDCSRTFYELLFTEIENVKEEDDEKRDEIINKVFADLVSDRSRISQATYNAVVGLDKFYACAVSVFSISKSNFFAAKTRLADKIAFAGQYNQGCYWLNELFGVLFDEPVTVIDIDRNIGFTGKISGIVDNTQLQYLLMGIPFMNDGKSAVSEEIHSVFDGTGPQQLEKVSAQSKWNMYNLELCRQPDWEQLINNEKNQSVARSFTDCWIWGEGIPSDISIHNGRRVILLGLPSYSRSSTIQRTFRNLKAGIEIEKELTEEEIKDWLYYTI